MSSHEKLKLFYQTLRYRLPCGAHNTVYLVTENFIINLIRYKIFFHPNFCFSFLY